MTLRTVSRSPRLIASLVAVLLLDIAASTGAYLRIGHWNPFTAVGRPAILIILAILALRQRGWARWLLIVWLTLGALAAFVYLASSMGLFALQIVLIGMAAVYIWAIVELSLDGISETSKTV